MENNTIYISPSPHIHSGDSIRKNMYGVLIAMVPAFLVSLYYFGLGALIVTATAVVSCMAFEYLIQKVLMKREPALWDGSAAITGILLAFNLPSNLPVWIIIIGSLAAIVIGKMSFGGLGNNIFNPALVGRVFLLISFPAQMTTWPVPGKFPAHYVDGETAATALSLFKYSPESLPTYHDMLLGNMGGSLGEVGAIALILGLIFMLVRKIITWHIPVAVIGTVALFTGIMHAVNPQEYASPVLHLLSGGLLLGAIFMATDYVTSPLTKKGMIIYGIGIGVLTTVIRLFGAYPEGMSFAILIMNAFTPLINSYVKPKYFGGR